MYLIPIPAFADNYLWLLHNGRRALVVDPGDAEPVFRFLTQHALQLESILVTHHHADHTGGVDALRQACSANVYGPAAELYKRVRPGLTGLWQISGRSDTTYSDRVSYDEWYILNWSLWYDFVILIQTAWIVLSGKGAF